MQRLSEYYTAGAEPIPEVSEEQVAHARAWFTKHFNIVNTTSRFDEPVEVELKFKDFLVALASYRASPFAPAYQDRCNVLGCGNPESHDSMKHFTL